MLLLGVLLWGLGLVPPTVALMLLGIPPLLAGTYAGIANVEQDLNLNEVQDIITALVTNRVRYLLSCSREVARPVCRRDRAQRCPSILQNPGRVPTGLMLLEDQVPYVLGSRPRFVLDQLRPRWQRSMAYTVRSEVRAATASGRSRSGSATRSASNTSNQQIKQNLRRIARRLGGLAPTRSARGEPQGDSGLPG